MKNKKLVAGLVLATMVLTGKYLHDQAFVGVEKKVTIKNSKVKSDLKITHISDLHSNVLSNLNEVLDNIKACLLYTSPSPRDGLLSRMPSSA